MVLIILAFTVFKIKKPQIHLERVTVQDFEAQVILNLPPSVSLNVTLALAVSVHNPNKAAFRYGNTSAFIFYRGVQVGAMPIPAGRLAAGGTATIASSLTLFAGVLLGDIRVYRDFIAGSLPITATARVSGRVDVFHIFKHHADASTVCNATITPLNGSGLIRSLDCTYDVKL
ncbi:hypothetical protein KP509_36G025000 [Ceratopteris richardii]|nr:hypothetical protein KP509_36G025000 [Ceratopteris richardii]